MYFKTDLVFHARDDHVCVFTQSVLAMSCLWLVVRVGPWTFPFLPLSPVIVLSLILILFGASHCLSVASRAAAAVFVCGRVT